MKKILFTLLCFLPLFTFSQNGPIQPVLENDAPEWVHLLYAETPNIFAIQTAFESYYKQHPYTEDNYTRYYSHWAIVARQHAQENGDVIFPDNQTLNNNIILRKNLRSEEGSRSTTWTFAGPEIHYTTKYDAGAPSIPISDHANIHSIDQCASNPDILYCGGETGGVYKTINKGLNWEHVTKGYYMNTIRALAVNPNNPDEVIATSEGELWKTSDGGVTWYITGDASFQAIYITAYDIVYNPENPSIVYAGCEQGFFRSTDGGENWTEILDHFCMSVAVKPDNPAIIYTLQYDPVTKIPYFKKSFDYGVSFTTYNEGWFEVPAVDAGKIESLGGRIAVTEANPDKVYVLLVGESNATAVLQLRGTIGVYVSNDGGESWNFPHELLGMPYNVDTHPNLMDFDGHSSDYDQIYYNTTLAVSHLNENKILVGGLNLWKSEDGATSYDAVGGYIGYLPYFHPDNQETKIYKTSPTTEEIWMATDGGVNYTTDWVETHESRSNGLQASNFWGFDQGWQEDVMVGGRYHNGNGGYNENYPAGTFLALGGGEAATGYVKPSDENICLLSDIGGVELPEELDGVASFLSFTNTPNESYWYNSSSRIHFDWNYYNYAYMGRDNSVWKSTDGGSSFTPIYTFGVTTWNKVLWVEQSRVDTKVIYLTQNIGSSNCKLWKSTDGGVSWTDIDLPQNKRDLIFTLSGDDVNELWIAYTFGADGSKVYHSTNGGTSWDNITSGTLNGLHPAAIVHQFGTDGGVYLTVREAAVFYRTNTFIDWIQHGDDLPLVTDALKTIPFYRDNKLRLASWNIGIWEAPLFEPSALIADFSTASPYFYCGGDEVKFVDRSTASATATYAWEFPGATPSSSMEKNPVVTYPTGRSFNVTLTINDGASVASITKTAIVSSLPESTLPLAENFETGTFASGWHGGESGGWAIADFASAYAIGTSSMYFNNYYTDLQGGAVEEISAKYNMEDVITATLNFVVAYRPYGGVYMDTLQILASTDCGATFTEIFYAGGNDLSTGGVYTADVFYPEADEWETHTIDMTSFAGADNLTLYFKNIGYWGQALYIDNININANFIPITEFEQQVAAVIVPNPNQGYFNLATECLQTQQAEIKLTNALGEIIYSTQQQLNVGDNTTVFDVQHLSKGVYFAVIQTGKQLTTVPFVIE